METAGVYAERRISLRLLCALYTFDKRGRLLESAFYKGDEKLETKLAYEYDAAGNRVKTIWSGTSKEGRVEPYTLERRIITYY